MNKIPVVYITDNNFVMPTLVSVTSVLKNKNAATHYDIYLIDVDLSNENKDKIKNSFSDIKIVKPKNNYKNINYTSKYVTNAAFYKFDIPLIFEGYDKILYLDSDTIIKSDLSCFYNENIEDYYAAVVNDMVGIIKNFDNKKLGLKNYFNTGVMLLNLKKMRENDITKKLVDARKAADNSYGDQEIFNLIFRDDVKFVSPNYNYMTTNNLFSNRALCKFYNVSGINPSIVHITSFKPWLYKNVAYNDLWMYYYRLSPYADKKLNLKEKAPKLYKQKIGIKWVVDIFPFRFSYEKGPKNFKITFKPFESYDYFL